MIKPHKIPLVLIVLLLTIPVLGWQLYSSHQRVQITERKLKQLEVHALALENQILELEEKLAIAESQTLEGMVDGANRALLEGWESLVDDFQNELQELQERIEENLDQGGNEST